MTSPSVTTNSQSHPRRSECYNSPSSVPRTLRLQHSRNSPYEKACRGDRPHTGSAQFSTVMPASPTSSASPPLPVNLNDRMDGPFTLTSAQWSTSSREEGSDTSDDISYTSVAQSRFSGDECEQPLLSLNGYTPFPSHRHKTTSPYTFLHSAPTDFAPRVMQLSSGHWSHSSAAPPPHHRHGNTRVQMQSHSQTSYAERHSFTPLSASSLERTVSAGPSSTSTSRPPRASSTFPFTRTSSVGLGMSSSCSLRSSEPAGERKKGAANSSREQFAAQTGLSLGSGQNSPSESRKHDCGDEEGGVEDGRGSSRSKKRVVKARTTGASVTNRFSGDEDDDTGDADAIPRRRWRMRHSASTSFKSSPPSSLTSEQAKKSNAGRAEVPVGLVNGRRRYLCPAQPPCPGHFSRKNDAYRHLDDRHGAGKERHVCGCGRQLSRKDALHRHYTTCQWVKENRLREMGVLEDADVDADADAEGEEVGDSPEGEGELEEEDIQASGGRRREKAKKGEKNYNGLEDKGKGKVNMTKVLLIGGAKVIHQDDDEGEDEMEVECN